MNIQSVSTVLARWVSRIPVTMSIGIAALVIACFPSAGNVLQFDRQAILAGEIWRLATGHLSHWGGDHIQWDLLMFVVLGSACEIRDPRRMYACLFAAAASVSVLVLGAFPEIAAYRGLSGVDTALFTLLAVGLLRDGRRQQCGYTVLVTGGLLLGFIAKTTFEAITGHAFFVDQQTAGFELLVWDHIVAAVVGVWVACVASADRSKPTTLCANGSKPTSTWMGLGLFRSWIKG